MTQWISHWEPIFRKHSVDLFIVSDGEYQTVARISSFLLKQNKEHTGDYLFSYSQTNSIEKLAGDEKHLFCRFNSSCKNVGLYAVAKWRPDTDVIVVLDDDVFPLPDDPKSDPIEEHLKVLDRPVPISWLSSAFPHMRGFPYGVRSEAPVKFSHGIWNNVYDRDSISTLSNCAAKVTFFNGAVPKGIYFPICGMNVAFKIEALPFVYFAPTSTFHGCERFDDIWMGIHLVREFAKLNWAIYSGSSVVWHERASDPFKNLEKEAVGIRVNETYWKNDFIPESYYHKMFFDGYDRKRETWKELIIKLK